MLNCEKEEFLMFIILCYNEEMYLLSRFVKNFKIVNIKI